MVSPAQKLVCGVTEYSILPLWRTPMMLMPYCFRMSICATLMPIMISVEINKIPDVVRAAANGGPLGQLFFRVDDFIRTVAQQKLGMDISGSPGDNQSGTQLL